MQKSGTDLESLVTWFRNFSDIDPKATLAFQPLCHNLRGQKSMAL